MTCQPVPSHALYDDIDGLLSYWKCRRTNSTWSISSLLTVQIVFLRCTCEAPVTPQGWGLEVAWLLRWSMQMAFSQRSMQMDFSQPYHDPCSVSLFRHILRVTFKESCVSRLQRTGRSDLLKVPWGLHICAAFLCCTEFEDSPFAQRTKSMPGRLVARKKLQ